MTSLFIDMLGNKIASNLEAQKINEDYENKLKSKIKHNTRDFIDAICSYLSNSELNECKRLKKLDYISNEDLKTVSKEDPVKYVKDASNKYIEKYWDVSPDDLSTFLLNYKPNNDVATQSGGDYQDIYGPRPSNDNNADAKAKEQAKAVIGNNIIPTAVPVPTGIPSGVPVPTGIPSGVPVPTGIPSGVPVPTGIPSGVPVPTGIPSGVPVPTGIPSGVPGLDIMSNMRDISKLTQVLEEKDLLNKLIKTNKAKELYEFYSDETLAKLSCNHEIHEYINDKIINTIFYIALKETEGDKVNKIKSLMLPVSQKVTETVINNKIQSLEKNTGIYKILFDSFKNKPDYVINIKTHTNAYLLTLLELFLHFKHNEVLNNPFSLNIKLEDINKRIDVLRTNELEGMINTELSKLLVNDIERINDLNKLQKNNEKDHNGNALKEFKKLFEEKPVEKKGGKRKQQSKRKSLRKNNRSKKKNR